jgi:hypothetical protein
MEEIKIGFGEGKREQGYGLYVTYGDKVLSKLHSVPLLMLVV